jgi:hypothetical protein
MSGGDLGGDMEQLARSPINLKAVLALHFDYYILYRIHGSLRVTPAMAAGTQ